MKRFVRVFAFAVALVLSLSVAIAALAEYSTIPYGEQSDAVRKMQATLRSKGYYKGAVDGKFGPATKSAVIKFQNAVGISADGRPGNKTLTALYEGKSAINKAKNTELKNSMEPTNPHTLYYGCTGVRVRELQSALKAAGCYKGNVDGVFGDLTFAAVKKYQSQRGLKADGMAGVKTLASLEKNTNKNIRDGFVLSMGSKGSEVRTLKRFLASKGYTMPIEDYYNETIRDAVKSWQASEGKTVTGTITESQYTAIVLGKE